MDCRGSRVAVSSPHRRYFRAHRTRFAPRNLDRLRHPYPGFCGYQVPGSRGCSVGPASARRTFRASRPVSFSSRIARRADGHRADVGLRRSQRLQKIPFFPNPPRFALLLDPFQEPVSARTVAVDVCRCFLAARALASTHEHTTKESQQSATAGNFFTAVQLNLLEALELTRKPVADDARPLRVFLACGFTPLHLQTFLHAHLREFFPEARIEIKTGLYGDLCGSLSG